MKKTTRKSLSMTLNEKRGHIAVLSAFVMFLLLISLMITGRTEAKVSKFSRDVEMVPGEILVKTKNTLRSSAFRKQLVERTIRQTMGVNEVLSIRTLSMDDQIQKVKIKDARKLSAVLQSLRDNPEVQYAEPNYIYHAFDLKRGDEAAAPTDTDFAKQWDMLNTGQPDKTGQLGTPGADVNVAPVWARGITGSKNILVAVIDTGVDYTHPDLAENIYENPGEAGELATNGIDDDGNGVIDDLKGANFVAGATGTNQSIDDHNHGTHCAGSIGAKGNNGIGITGVNWDVSILPIKFLSAQGSGSLEGAVNSIKYATKMKVNIMSNSWGGGGYSEALKEAIEEAERAGILFVAAAGNDASNNDSSPSYPASYPIANVVSVASTNNQDVLSNFSNYGVKSVHVAAPGDQILSTVKGGGYDTYRGTSMACPHVAGMAALLLSHENGLTYAQLKERLMTTSTPVRGLRRSVAARGRVNMLNAIDNIVPPSDEPDPSLWQDQEFIWESAHPYANNFKEEKEVSVPGARYIRVVFEKVDLEPKYDTVKLVSSSGEVIEAVSSVAENHVTDYAQGDKITLKFETDSSVNKWGFKIAKIQVIF
jgi:thermitase